MARRPVDVLQYFCYEIIDLSPQQKPGEIRSFSSSHMYALSSASFWHASCPAAEKLCCNLCFGVLRSRAIYLLARHTSINHSKLFYPNDIDYLKGALHYSYRVVLFTLFLVSSYFHAEPRKWLPINIESVLFFEFLSIILILLLRLISPNFDFSQNRTKIFRFPSLSVKLCLFRNILKYQTNSFDRKLQFEKALWINVISFIIDNTINWFWSERFSCLKLNFLVVALSGA